MDSKFKSIREEAKMRVKTKKGVIVRLLSFTIHDLEDLQTTQSQRPNAKVQVNDGKSVYSIRLSELDLRRKSVICLNAD